MHFLRRFVDITTTTTHLGHVKTAVAQNKSSVPCAKNLEIQDGKMTWTLEKWNALFAWSAATVAFIMAGGDPPSSFRRAYSRLRENYLTIGPPAWMFSWAWSMIVPMLVAGGVLYTIGYEACDQRYYIAVCALALGHLVFLSMWGRTFWRYNSPRVALTTLFLAFGCSVAVVVLMALTATSSCAVPKTNAWIAFGLWLAPHVWYIVAIVLNIQWLNIPANVLRSVFRIDSKAMPLVTGQRR